jgi:superfamily II DNA or RNA helicase
MCDRLIYLMSKLRDYQQRAIAAIYQEWRHKKYAVLLAMPTGSGKTRTFSEIAQHFASRNEQVLLLCHREELLRQSQQTLEAIAGVPVGLIQGDRPLNLDRLIQCASVQTLVRRLESGQIKLPDVSLAIVDEAHLSLAASYLTIISHLPRALVLGVTATPCRLDGRGFDELYDTLVLGPEVAKLIERGYLADYDILTPESFIPTDDQSIRITGGDFNLGDLAERIDRRYVAGKAVEAYMQHARGKRCVVFAINIEHSKAIAERYQAEGITAEHIDGDTVTKERQAILARFRSGETRVLSNVNLFTEGFDLPEIEVVQLCRPTQSVALHLQMVGRGLRPKRGQKALILDHAGNCLRLGGPRARRGWTLQGIIVEPEPEFVPSPEVTPRYLDLPTFPKRQVEIFETGASMGYIPTTTEVETQLANAAYRDQKIPVGAKAGSRSGQNMPSRSPQPDPRSHGQSQRQSQRQSQNRDQRPANSGRRSTQPQKQNFARQIGKAALELAELLESILKWMRNLWSRPQPQKKRRKRRDR